MSQWAGVLAVGVTVAFADGQIVRVVFTSIVVVAVAFTEVVVVTVAVCKLISISIYKAPPWRVISAGSYIYIYIYIYIYVRGRFERRKHGIPPPNTNNTKLDQSGTPASAEKPSTPIPIEPGCKWK